MADNEPETKEEREARWWRDWWSTDYSWDGLARKEIIGGGQWGEKTLQDYWRRDPISGDARTDEQLRSLGELVEFEGRWWHLVHLPPRSISRDQNTWKVETGDQAQRTHLAKVLQARLNVARDTPGRFRFIAKSRVFTFQPTGVDGRALLDGAIIQSFPQRIQSDDRDHRVNRIFYLSCIKIYFCDRAEFSDVEFGEGANFDGASFSKGGNFVQSKFANESRFTSAKFDQYVDFSRSKFSGDANFSNMTAFSYVGFDEASFVGRSQFMRSEFFGPVDFSSAMFSKGASFLGAVFGGYARFDGAEVGEDSVFDNCKFRNDAEFIEVRFNKSAFYRNVIFSRGCAFRDVEFAGPAVFSQGEFSAAASFSGAFKGKGAFHNAVFQRQIAFSARIERPETGFAGAFYGTRFADIADFSRSGSARVNDPVLRDGARMAIAFSEALFEKTLILTDGAEGAADKAFREGALATILAEEPERREELLDKLEAGCRTVKIAMGKARDEVREQRYYRFQLQARHARADTHWAEKFFGGLYGLVSGYGGSLGRPLVWLFGGILVLGVVYWLWAGGMNGTIGSDIRAIVTAPLRGESWNSLSAAVGFSTSRSIFLSAWLGVPEKDPTTWQWVFLNGYGAGWGLLVRAVAALQSILSGVLIFLFALAVRRRFQIGG